MLPFRFESSIKSMVHTSSFRLESTANSPSQLLIVGGSREEGNGMMMETFSYSMTSEASYSMETKDSPPDTDGQQLMTIGTLLSSLDWKRHFKIPSALPQGNGLFGSFNPKIPSLACNCLSMFGCVLNWYPSFAPVSILTFTNASSSFWISIIIVPCTSMLSKPPSLDKWTFNFSSTMMLTDSCGTCGTCVLASFPLVYSASTDSPSCRKASMNRFVFCFEPKTIPFLGPAFAARPLGPLGSP
mmetsp:Transcript_7498/g.22571  ORF Transcript_7498/g.22571 Transcript_7498/m.22571 type:complete len:243 (+) Transcript_7498:170-898(+)